jgi:hypothetical protein
MARSSALSAATSPRVHFNRLRSVAGGWFATLTPGRRGVAGRIGRWTNPPPQFGQTLNSTVSTQVAQKVHS